MKVFFFLVLTILSVFQLHAQSIGVGNADPDSSAILDIKSTTQGVLLSRLTTAQRRQINDPAQGLLVFDTDKNTFYMFEGNQWVPLAFILDPLALPVRAVNDAIGLESNDNWGFSLDIDGDYAIIGAPFDDIEEDMAQGAAFIYFRDNGVWTEQEKLFVTNPGSPGDHFGQSVAISGNYAVVGAPLTDLGGLNKGNAYIFRRNGTNWTQVARLRAVDTNAGAYFGWAVDIDGDYVVIGAIDADTVGKAYVFFNDSSWVTNQPYQAKLELEYSTSEESFGYSVSIDGNNIVVGDPHFDFSGVDRGAAFLFTRIDTTWELSDDFLQEDEEDSDHYGISVSVNGDYVVVGAPDDDIGLMQDQGSAYVYFNGIFQTQLIAPDGDAMDAFGTDVSLSGDYVMVGAPFKNSNPITEAGGAYLFKRNGTVWTFMRSLEDETPMASGLFGYSTCLDVYNLLIGAPGKNDEKGAIYYINIE